MRTVRYLRTVGRRWLLLSALSCLVVLLWHADRFGSVWFTVSIVGMFAVGLLFGLGNGVFHYRKQLARRPEELPEGLALLPERDESRVIRIRATLLAFWSALMILLIGVQRGVGAAMCTLPLGAALGLLLLSRWVAAAERKHGVVLVGLLPDGRRRTRRERKEAPAPVREWTLPAVL